MNKYELMTIANIKLGEDGAVKVSNSIKDLISSLNGKVLDSSFWGKRKFSYEIKHEDEGFYDVITFELPQEMAKELRTKLNYMTGLVRYLVTAE